MVKPFSGFLQPRNNLTPDARDGAASAPREVRTRPNHRRGLRLEEMNTPRRPQALPITERQTSPKRPRRDTRSNSTLEDSPRLLDNGSEDEADVLSQGPVSNRKRRRTEVNAAEENGQYRGWHQRQQQEARSSVDAMMDSSNYPTWRQEQKMTDKLRAASSNVTTKPTGPFPQDIVTTQKLNLGMQNQQQPRRAPVLGAASGRDGGTKVKFALNYVYRGGAKEDFDELVFHTTGGDQMLRYLTREIDQKQSTNLKDVIKVTISDSPLGKKVRLILRTRERSWIDLEIKSTAEFEHFVGILDSYKSFKVLRRPDHWLENARNKSEQSAATHHLNLDADLAEANQRHRDSSRRSIPEQSAEPRRKLSARLESNQMQAPVKQMEKVPAQFSPSLEQTPARLTRRVTRSISEVAAPQPVAEPKHLRQLRSEDHDSPDDVAAIMTARHRDFGSKWKRPLVYPQAGKKRATVEYEDLLRLDDGEFFNDNIIGFYLRYLMEMIEDARPHDAERIYWFNSYFFEKLTDSPRARGSINYDAVKRWTRDVDLFTYDYIVVPVNESAHWYLVLICNLPRLFHNDTCEAQEEAKVPGSSPHHPIGIDESQEANAKPSVAAAAGRHSIEDLVERVEEAVAKEYSPESRLDPMLEVPASPDQRGEAYSDLMATADSSGIPRLSGMIAERRVLGDITDTIVRDPSVQSRMTQRKKKRPSIRQFDPLTPAIITLDSLGIAHPGTTRALKQYLVQEAADKKGDTPFDESSLQGMNAKGIPQQDNFCDCGPYLLAYMDKFTKDPSGFVRKLLQKEFDESSDWPTQLQPSRLRSNIRRLILRLQGEQQSGARRSKGGSQLLASDPMNAEEDSMRRTRNPSQPATDAAQGAPDLGNDIVKSSLEELSAGLPAVNHHYVPAPNQASPPQTNVPIEWTVIPDSQNDANHSLELPRSLNRPEDSMDRMVVDTTSSPPPFMEQLKRAATAGKQNDHILLDEDP